MITVFIGVRGPFNAEPPFSSTIYIIVYSERVEVRAGAVARHVGRHGRRHAQRWLARGRQAANAAVITGRVCVERPP